MSNDRIFYACVGVLIKSDASGSDAPQDGTFLTGVQSVGVNSDFPSASLPDTGRAKRKYHFYSPQSFEITIERIIDKDSNFFYYPSNYSTYQNSHILNNDNLGSDGIGNLSKGYDVTVLYGSDDQGLLNDGTTVQQVTYRNCLISSISYNMSVDGPITESVSLTTRAVTYNETTSVSSYTLPATAQSGNVLKRSHLDFLNESPLPTRESLLPSEVEDMFDAGGSQGDKRILGINSIDLEVSIDYSDIIDTGRWRGSVDQGKQNLYRFIVLPVQVTCSFTGTSRQVYPYALPNVDDNFSPDGQIRLVSQVDPLSDYFIWDLGGKNYLTNISYDGADTGGGNLQATMSYQNDHSDAVLVKDSVVRDLTNVMF